MTERRQRAFLKAYKRMFDDQKAQAASETKCKKCTRYGIRALIGLVIFAFFFPILKGMLYKSMGWELEMPPPPSFNQQPVHPGSEMSFEEYMK